jgi:cytochrome oxidase Cu insertion factor (SCO1/SenC/PrrC family)
MNCSASPAVWRPSTCWPATSASSHARHGEPEDRDYLVDHGSAVLLINPQGRLQAVFQAPHRAGRMIADLERILRHHGARS